MRTFWRHDDLFDVMMTFLTSWWHFWTSWRTCFDTMKNFVTYFWHHNNPVDSMTCYLAWWRDFYVMRNFLTSSHFCVRHDELFDVMTHFLMMYFLCHDELDVMTYFLCRGELFDDMTHFLTCFSRHDNLFVVLTYFCRFKHCSEFLVQPTNFLTSWRIFDVMANFVTWHFLTCFSRHDKKLFVVPIYFCRHFGNKISYKCHIGAKIFLKQYDNESHNRQTKYHKNRGNVVIPVDICN